MTYDVTSAVIAHYNERERVFRREVVRLREAGCPELAEDAQANVDLVHNALIKEILNPQPLEVRET